MTRHVLGGMLASFLATVPVPAAAQTPASSAVDAHWTLAAVGDVIMNRRLRQFDTADDPAFHDMAAVIRGADAAFLNLEQSVFRLQDFDGWPAAESGGNYELGSPETLEDLVSFGFDLFNRANNHATDYGVAGLRATDRLMDRMGLVHAGTGETLGWASRPGYLETVKGRIALIGMASSHTTMSRAGDAAPDVPGRPGLNPLRLSTRYEASPETMRALRGAAGAQGVDVPEEASAPVRVFGTTVYPGARDRTVVTLDERDRDRVLDEVRNAADQADHVVVSSHSHEPGNEFLTPPDWLVELSHQAIDAGATTFIVHGPHQLRGIEIYDGRPIFYSLGNFVFHIETIDPMPTDARIGYGATRDALSADVYDTRFRVGDDGRPTTGFPTGSQWYESVVAVSEFAGDELVELRLYPIELGWKAPRSQRGTPRLAPEPEARQIVEHLAELSRPFGTEIRYEDGIGVWRR